MAYDVYHNIIIHVFVYALFGLIVHFVRVFYSINPESFILTMLLYLISNPIVCEFILNAYFVLVSVVLDMEI